MAMRPGLASRRTALDLLAAVLDRHQPLDDVLAAASEPYSSRDRAFIRSLVAVTLRRLPEIDARIDRCLNRPLPRRAARVRHLLRLGLAQLVFLDMAPHAVVDTAVGLAQADRQPAVRRLASLVNAVLRRVSREGPRPLSFEEAGAYNTPAWLWRRWERHYGADTARGIAAAHMAVPPRDLTLKPAEDPGLWAARLGGQVLPMGSVRCPAEGVVTDLPGYDTGVWWVQDVAAALPVRLAGDVAGLEVIDLCAAPGGKTAQLAAAGARVTAVDRAVPRLARLTANLERLGLTAEVITADAAEWQPRDAAPLVLLDAPCSATGTIRRHPDIPHLKTREDIDTLAGVQAALLDNAARMVAPAGRLIYCTCSLEPEEGETQIARFLARHPAFRRRPVAPAELPGLAGVITADGDVRTLPAMWAAQGGMDGFFIARLVRD